MGELAELYAACIVEYATHQPNGVLTGSSDVFGSDACKAHKLPYKKDLIDDACRLLKNMEMLTEYRHVNVPIHYSVRRAAFDNGMIVEGNGERRYKKFLGMSAVGAAASYIQVLSGFQKQPSPTLLESYADLGADYLRQLLKSFDPQLSQIGVGEIDSQDQRQSLNLKIPASDRLVTLSDNQQSELDNSTTELIEIVEKQNGVDGDQSMKQQIVGQLKAGRELVRAGVFKIVLIEQTILSVLGGLIEKYKNQAIGHAAKKLLDLVIEYVVGK